jgi:hypothetical protein
MGTLYRVCPSVREVKTSKEELLGWAEKDSCGMCRSDFTCGAGAPSNLHKT